MLARCHLLCLLLLELACRGRAGDGIKSDAAVVLQHTQTSFAESGKGRKATVLWRKDLQQGESRENRRCTTVPAMLVWRQ